MKERITRNIKKLFELDKDHYKPVNLVNLVQIVILNMKVMATQIKHYILKRI